MHCGPTDSDQRGDADFATVHPKDVDTSELATLDLNIYTTSSSSSRLVA